MKSELETEHKKDTELFEKMECWSGEAVEE